MYFLSELIITTIFTLILLLLPLQIYWAISISRWAKRLRYHPVSEEQALEVINFFRKVWYIPNAPKYWGECKNIYYAVLHSPVVTFETKKQLFTILERRKVYGLRPPYKKKQNHF
ncbi:hypothetical protein C0966_07340 [Bacillus methanolicus]|uniref:hypothetical protein n=1 Tax=Bacillus methanolicus TaxID=1471 RepID=UPI0023801151|nr:hypothetical protein [Bacillus methanolicus]MDE3839173.1 hypothetical protein [Bacillus methanolicus]